MKKVITVTAIVFLFMIISAVQGVGEITPGNTLMPQINKVVARLQKLKPEEKGELKYTEIYGIIESTFDFRTLSMLSLGVNWKRFSEKQKTEFTDLFSRLITQLYLDKIKGQDIQDVRVEYGKTAQIESASERADVHTVVHHNGTQTPVVYRMILTDNGWRVYDVIIEGVSMVGNYREQYRKKMFDTPESMINEIREKLEQ